MSAIRIAAIAILVLGVLGLVYGGFSYTTDSHKAKVGSLELSVGRKETINIPIWAGLGAILIGGALLLIRR